MHPSSDPAALVAGRAVSLSFFIPASAAGDNPIEPLHRHRVRVMTPKGRKPIPQVYADPRSARWEEYVATEALARVRALPIEGDGEDFILPLREVRVLMTLRFNLPKPKSYSARVVHHVKKPDIDNYAKALIDGLVKGRVLEDDGCITDLTILKRYVAAGHPEGVEVDLTALPVD